MNTDRNPDYRNWLSKSPLLFKKQLTIAFIENTIKYAEEHLKKRKKELLELKSANANEISFRKQRIAKWESYIEFQNHTLQELNGDKIDNFIP